MWQALFKLTTFFFIIVLLGRQHAASRCLRFRKPVWRAPGRSNIAGRRRRSVGRQLCQEHGHPHRMPQWEPPDPRVYLEPDGGRHGD
jgi:hypothetical protein